MKGADNTILYMHVESIPTYPRLSLRATTSALPHFPSRYKFPTSVAQSFHPSRNSRFSNLLDRLPRISIYTKIAPVKGFIILSENLNHWPPPNPRLGLRTLSDLPLPLLTQYFPSLARTPISQESQAFTLDSVSSTVWPWDRKS